MPSIYIVIIYLAAMVNSHMQLAQPFPIRSPLDKQSTNKDYSYAAPLKPDGSDYPCKGYHKDAFRATAKYQSGQDYSIKIAGGAPHGGGSCQISLSHDNGETFRVIKSIIGGCPLKKEYSFTVPRDAPPGNALLAWTWFNKIGNREMYMNCAQVTIVSGNKRGRAATATAFNSLPNIFTANINGEGRCKTREGADIIFPDIGPDVEYGPGGSGKPKKGFTCDDGGQPPDGAPALPSDTPQPSPTSGLQSNKSPISTSDFLGFERSSMPLPTSTGFSKSPANDTGNGGSCVQRFTPSRNSIKTLTPSYVPKPTSSAKLPPFLTAVNSNTSTVIPASVGPSMRALNLSRPRKYTAIVRLGYRHIQKHICYLQYHFAHGCNLSRWTLAKDLFYTGFLWNFGVTWWLFDRRLRREWNSPVGITVGLVEINNCSSRTDVATSRKPEHRPETRGSKDIELAKIRSIADSCGIAISSRPASDFATRDIDQDLARLLKNEHATGTLPQTDLKLAMGSAAALIKYLGAMSDPSNFGQYQLYQHDLSQYMKLDSAALRALNLMPGPRDGAKSMSLYGLLNHCKTPVGGRLLAQWLKQPLMNHNDIEKSVTSSGLICVTVSDRGIDISRARLCAISGHDGNGDKGGGKGEVKNHSQTCKERNTADAKGEDRSQKGVESSGP
ncbi:predicted protein [Uncinocarpus reesii 1704]|uniref:DNA mismatch repair protein MutS core domain-containing protein n=1 Tax=Uncinocarpus reesii (strain UAMH 1704) TaxID=336963 RepID=C4JKV1_UNCRE|nr:uncharacterized protein UREG_00166 [Uncinocarpus reesii 1704]EEP75320.1 predicted protein [Uncinocarpus reesii 1704]